MNDFCYQKQNWQHDAQVRTSDGVHPFVRVWYSPSLFRWIAVRNRQGSVPNGAIVVKEQYKTLTAPLMGWDVMVKDSSLSFDGWYWAHLVFPSPANPNATPTPSLNGCAEPQVLLNGAGLKCLNCHASAIDNQGTYASTAHLGPQIDQSASTRTSALPIADDVDKRLARMQATSSSEAGLAPRFTGQLPGAVFINLRALPQVSVPCMVSEAFDHVISRAKSEGPPQVVTSDQCACCHDATETLKGPIPNMIFDAQGPSPVNLSQ